jgi:hypothetical protein
MHEAAGCHADFVLEHYKALDPQQCLRGAEIELRVFVDHASYRRSGSSSYTLTPGLGMHKGCHVCHPELKCDLGSGSWCRIAHLVCGGTYIQCLAS